MESRTIQFINVYGGIVTETELVVRLDDSLLDVQEDLRGLTVQVDYYCSGGAKMQHVGGQIMESRTMQVINACCKIVTVTELVVRMAGPPLDVLRDDLRGLAVRVDIPGGKNSPDYPMPLGVLSDPAVAAAARANYCATYLAVPSPEPLPSGDPPAGETWRDRAIREPLL